MWDSCPTEDMGAEAPLECGMHGKTEQHSRGCGWGVHMDQEWDVASLCHSISNWLCSYQGVAGIIGECGI